MHVRRPRSGSEWQYMVIAQIEADVVQYFTYYKHHCRLSVLICFLFVLPIKNRPWWSLCDDFWPLYSLSCVWRTQRTFPGQKPKQRRRNPTDIILQTQKRAWHDKDCMSWSKCKSVVKFQPVNKPINWPISWTLIYAPLWLIQCAISFVLPHEAIALSGWKID